MAFASRLRGAQMREETTKLSMPGTRPGMTRLRASGRVVDRTAGVNEEWRL